MSVKKSSAARTKKMAFAALYLAIALVLPFLTGQIREIGNMLCPMHLPVLLCGFTCGGLWGLAVGALAPLLRSALFGMPQLFPQAVAMAFELAGYGLFSGLLYKALPKKTFYIYVSLIASMILGRVIYGLFQVILYQVQGNQYTLAMFVAASITKAIPGIILQLILIPILVKAIKKSGLAS